MKQIFFQVMSVFIMLFCVGCASETAPAVSTLTYDSSESNDFGKEALSYAEFYMQYPEFHGKWELLKVCASANIAKENLAYIAEMCPGRVLEVTKGGISFLGNCYTQSPFEDSMMFRYTKNEICSFNGELAYENLPLPDSEDRFTYFQLALKDQTILPNKPEFFQDFSLCMYEEDMLFLGIDQVYFMAVRTSSSDNQPNDTSEAPFQGIISYEDFYHEYPALCGQWKIGEVCVSAKISDGDYTYIVENCPNQILDITQDGIKLLGNCYTQLPSSFHSFVCYYTKAEICMTGGYLDEDKIPLPDSNERFEYIELWLEDINIEEGSSDFFETFNLCIYDENKLFLGINGVFFTAEKMTTS